MMMKRMMVVLGLLVFASAPVYAQVPGINVHVAARVGLFSPLSELAETTGGDLQLGSGVGFGASIELDIPFSPVNIRANVDASMGNTLELEDDELEGAEIDVVNFTGDLVWRPMPRIVVVQPYLLLGAGVKKYSFNTEGGTFGSDRNDFTWHLGAGADMKVGPIALVAEISDYISSFKNEGTEESKLQNDVFLMVGFRIGML